MYEQISKNRVKTYFIIAFFLIFIGAIGYFIGIYIDYRYQVSDNFSILIMLFALIIAVITSFASYYNSDKIVLGLTRAKPVTRDEDPRVYFIVEGLSIAAGIPMPRIYVIEDNALNAFATGRNPEKGVIVFTRGLIDNLNDQELKGVAAHELSHIKNYDILLGTIIVVLVGMITIISNILLRSFFFGGRRRSSRSSGGVLSLVLLIIGVILILLSPLIATIIRLAISRNREFLADSSGALITRYPAGLASALKKISAQSEVKTANNATAHLFISNPVGKKTAGILKNLFNTHPPVEERIKRLEQMSLGIGL
ncbi:MAG: M48 family metallopeptidase [Actinomycetota bacterium]|nr:M48 family metallopeptidase [Actinomycetota bacterium]